MNIVFAHELTVFIIAIWGYIALLLTGEFSTPILLAACVLALIAYLIRLRNIYIPRWIWNVVSVAALVVTLGMASRQLLDATVYLFIFLQMVKLFTARTPDEMRWCYVVSLFNVIGASVLTTSMSFGMIFLAYVLLMIFSLMLYTLRRESENIERYALKLTNDRIGPAPSRYTIPRLSVPWALQTRLPKGLVWTTGILTILVMAGTLLTFAVVPRLATQNLFQVYGKPPDMPSTSAFDESIEFGTFERIQLDNAVAMYVQPLNSDRGDHVRLRGIALDTFDGKAWRRNTQAYRAHGASNFVAFSTRLYKQVVQYRMIQPPGVTNYLFADTYPESITLQRGLEYWIDTASGGAWLQSMYPKEIQYTTESRLERLEDRQDPAKDPDGPDRPAYQLLPHRQSFGFDRPTADTRREGPETTADTSGPQTFSAVRRIRQDVRRGPMRSYLDLCTSVPELLNTPRVRELARQWTADATTSFEMAMALERRFRTDYGYTLEPKSRGNFIEDFLFRTREGHCEYFATSMAMLARTLALPARVVNGYYCVEWNQIGGNFTIRQRDAHSWVEVWLGDDYGWMTFDPTPPAGVGRPVNRNPLILSILRFGDAMRVRWYRYVVDYSMNDQAAIVRALMRARAQISRVFERLHQLSPFDNEDTGSQPAAELDDRPVLSIAVGGAILALFAWFIVQSLRKLLRKRHRRPETMIRYYADLIKLLGGRGWHLQSGETPREFATKVSTIPEFADFGPITEIYYQSRYLGHELDEDEANLVAQFKTMLQRLKRGEAKPEGRAVTGA